MRNKIRIHLQLAAVGAMLVGLSSDPAQAGTLAVFHTAWGDIDVELFDQDKPVTVQNFLRYIQAGLYDDEFFHRWVPGFVIQGGGFYVVRRGQTNAALAAIPTSPAITNEFNVGRKFSNTYGTLAMARVGGQTNSATSQWFFNLADNSGLDAVDGGFSVFGRVISGTNVLDRFNVPDPTNNLYQVNLGAPFSQLPVLSTNLTYDNLFYARIDIVRLSVAVRPLGGPLLRWNHPVPGPDILEATDGWPAAWRTLAVLNSRAGQLEFQDTNIVRSRFYRVRPGIGPR